MRVWIVCLLYCVALSAAVHDVTSLEGDLADSIFGEFQGCPPFVGTLHDSHSLGLDRIE